MIESATGIILRTRLLTDTSLIVHWLTPAFGRLATVAKGARRPKSPFAGKLDLFYLADLSFVRSRRSELHLLREVGLRETHPALRRDLTLLRQASYAAALIEQTTETETPLPALFALLRDWLANLQAGGLPGVFAFELKLLDELGLTPDLDRASLSPGTKEIVRRFLGSDWAELARLRLSAGQTEELRRFLHGFLIYHLGRVPPGRVS